MLRRVSSTSRAPRLSLHIGEESRRLAERRDSITSQPPPYTAEREWTSTTLPRYIAPQLTTREQQNEALASSHNAVPPGECNVFEYSLYSPLCFLQGLAF